MANLSDKKHFKFLTLFSLGGALLMLAFLVFSIIRFSHRPGGTLVIILFSFYALICIASAIYFFKRFKQARF